MRKTLKLIAPLMVLMVATFSMYGQNAENGEANSKSGDIILEAYVHSVLLEVA